MDGRNGRRQNYILGIVNTGNYASSKGVNFQIGMSKVDREGLAQTILTVSNSQASFEHITEHGKIQVHIFFCTHILSCSDMEL